MIDPKRWYSLDGTHQPIAKLDDQHLENAIACVERNDPRYGVMHGVALPELRAEKARRLARPLFTDPPYANMPATSPRCMLAWEFKIPCKGVEIGTTASGDPVRMPVGVPTITSIDDRAGRAHRRIDLIDVSTRSDRLTIADLLQRVLDLEARMTTIETPPAKAKAKRTSKRRAR